MNKINSINILISTSILALVSLFVLNYSNDSLNQSIKNKIVIEQTADEFISLQNSWKHKDMKRQIQKIAKSTNIKNINISDNRNAINIKINNEKITNIDKFLNKTLNKNFVIHRLLITENSVELEIGK
jgi:hypothetical protein